MAKSVILFIVVLLLLKFSSEISFHAFDQASGVLIRIFFGYFSRSFSFRTSHFKFKDARVRFDEIWEKFSPISYFRSMANHQSIQGNIKNCITMPSRFWLEFFFRKKYWKFLRTVSKKKLGRELNKIKYSTRRRRLPIKIQHFCFVLFSFLFVYLLATTLYWVQSPLSSYPQIYPKNTKIYP